MSAYDNPTKQILTGKVEKGKAGSDVPTAWVLVSGTIKSLGESDAEIATEEFVQLNVENLNQIEAGAEAGFDFVAGLTE